jgi:hypothetical protein
VIGDGLLVILVLLQVADWITTRRILIEGGREENPLMRAAFSTLGVDCVLAIKTVLVALGGFVIREHYPLVVALLCSIYIAVLIHNVKQL